MPSTSAKQHRFMEAVARLLDRRSGEGDVFLLCSEKPGDQSAGLLANSAKFARKAGVPQSVGKDFAAADKAGGKFKSKHAKKRG